MNITVSLFLFYVVFTTSLNKCCDCNRSFINIIIIIYLLLLCAIPCSNGGTYKANYGIFLGVLSVLMITYRICNPHFTFNFGVGEFKDIPNQHYESR